MDVLEEKQVSPRFARRNDITGKCGPMNGLIRHGNNFPPVSRQVFPCRILLLDQRNFLLPPPFLDLSLAVNSGLNMLKDFVVHQPINAIPARKSSALPCFVLQNSRHEEPSHTDVNCPALARQDIDVITPASHEA